MHQEYHYSNSDEVYSNDYVWNSVSKYLTGPSSTVIDVGCGNGFMTNRISKLGHKVVGLDTSETGIEHARKKFSSLDFHVHSAYADLKAVRGPVDSIVSCEMIEHLMSPQTFLNNAFNGLKPGGKLILSTPYHGYIKNLLLSVFNKWDRHFSVDWEGGHVKFFSKKSLEEMLTKAGFERVSFSYAGRFPWLWKSMICQAFKP